MKLNTIQREGQWSNIADSLNENFSKVDNAVEALNQATIKNVGYFSTVDALREAYPIASAGVKAYVGATYPFAIYLWDANTSTWVDSGKTGGEESVNLGDYYTKEETDEKVAELESEIVSSFFVGQGNVYIEKKLTSLIPSKQYRILINANTSATDGTSGYRFKLEAYDSAGTSLGVLAYTAQGKNLKDYYDITLPSNAAYVTIGGRCGSGDLFRYTITPLLGKNNEDIYLEKDKSIQIYVDSTSSVTIEENINKGYLFISYTGNLNIRRSGQVLWSGTIQTLATLLGLDLVASTKGIADCIQMASQTILAVDSASDMPVIIQRDKLSLQYTPIIANFAGQCVYVAQGVYNAIDALKGKDEILANIKRNTFISTFCEEDVKVKADEYCAMLNNSNIVENFIFFTDQHYGSQDGLSMDTELMQSHINIIEKYFNATPTDFVMSGGDWLNKGDTQVQACAKLGYIDGFMNAKFKKYYPILGNHDTNNQGIANEGAAAYSGVLSNETIANLWFRNWGKNYYDFQTARVHWIILDTQHDFAPEMNDYKWQQIAWLGERLKANVYSNVVIAFHIYWQQESNNEISPITNNALNMAAAFNNKTTITLNGVVYDFSQTQGMVRCAICGHSHKDFNLMHNGIPVIATDRTGTSAIPTFDFVCLDFTNKKFKSVRVGSGENREISIL